MKETTKVVELSDGSQRKVFGTTEIFPWHQPTSEVERWKEGKFVINYMIHRYYVGPPRNYNKEVVHRMYLWAITEKGLSFISNVCHTETDEKKLNSIHDDLYDGLRKSNESWEDLVDYPASWVEDPDGCKYWYCEDAEFNDEVPSL
jgi:hypothetical protein